MDVRSTRRFGFGSLDLRAGRSLAGAGDRLLAGERFDLVYFSTTAFGVMPLGRRWQRRYGVPYVLDLQDPWLTTYYDQPGSPPPPGGRLKYALSRSVARIFEAGTLRHAGHIICVSPDYPALLLQRYPWLDAERFTVLPFGAPELDFELLRREPVRQDVFDPNDGLEHWVYVGAAGAIMRHALRAFFTALRQARDEQPQRFERLRLHFVGTDYASGARARKSVEPVASECGVAAMVEERPHRVPYFEALQCLLDAHALVVPGSDDASYVASKIYPYILARKPMLAIFHEQSGVVETLRASGAATVVAFHPREPATQVAARIRSAWFQPQRWRTPPATNPAALAPYTARELTRRQCAVFDGVLDAAG